MIIGLRRNLLVSTFYGAVTFLRQSVPTILITPQKFPVQTAVLILYVSGCTVSLVRYR